jgi:predicted enzyme related to lactoylglutathione lyase
MSNMNPVVHFELPAEDSQRMIDFYSKAFGWQAQILGPEMGNYIVVTTAETDENRMVKEPGRINGGFYKKTKDDQHPVVVIGVEDIRESMRKVEEAGGKLLGGRASGEPDDIPGVGLYISFIDTEGNRTSMLQPAKRG